MEAIQKIQKMVKVRPLFLDSLTSRRVIHPDYCDFESNKIMVLKDQYSL